MGWFSTKHVILETFIGCDLRIDRPIVTACRWTILEVHPTFSNEQLQIAAACLNYGQMLVNHVPTQEEVFGRAEFGAKTLLDGGDEFKYPEWTLEIPRPPNAPADMQTVRVTLWPCLDWGVDTMADIGDQGLPVPCRKYTSTTTPAGDSLRADTKWKPGYEMIFAPAAGLLPLNDLSSRLDPNSKITLARCVMKMNEYFRTSGANVGADREAFRTAQQYLQE